MTRILLFSGQPVLISGMAEVLRRNGFECAQPGEAAPHLILLDVTSGFSFDTLNRIRIEYDDCPLVLWADRLPLDLVFKTLEFGVRGIVPRIATPDQLVEALRKVSGGELQIGFQNTAFKGNNESKKEEPLNRRSARLTPREREIISLLQQGLRNRQIASAMGITEGTVKIYLFRLFHKLGVRNRLELARHGATDRVQCLTRAPRVRDVEWLEQVLA